MMKSSVHSPMAEKENVHPQVIRFVKCFILTNTSASLGSSFPTPSKALKLSEKSSLKDVQTDNAAVPLVVDETSYPEPTCEFYGGLLGPQLPEGALFCPPVLHPILFS